MCALAGDFVFASVNTENVIRKVNPKIAVSQLGSASSIFGNIKCNK